MAQITEFVGAALQACLDGRAIKSKCFNVFPAPQAVFRAKTWTPVSPEQMRINERLSHLRKPSDFMTIAQGFVTGADKDPFDLQTILPDGEERIYIDYLPDRQIGRYSIRNGLRKWCFSR